MVSGGQILVKALQGLAVDRVFCVAGESYLPVLDALVDYPDIQVITCRHESGASFMAEAYANLTGKPGVVMVTRGPGACNASIGIHTAKQSSAPVIMFVGLVSTADEGKEAFQEFNLPQMFGSHTKWADVVRKIQDIPNCVAKAFDVAMEDRPGPAVLGLPEDILFNSIDGEASSVKAVGPSLIEPADDDLIDIQELLSSAERPLVLVGGSLWSDEGCKDLEHFIENSDLPVVVSFRRQDLFNHKHQNYIGELGTGPNPALVKRVKQADVILVLGARLNEITTQGYTLFEAGQKIIHVYLDDDVFGKAYEPTLVVKAHLCAVIEGLGSVQGDWQDWREEGRQEYEVWTDIQEEDVGWNGTDMTQVFRQLRDLLPEDAIVTTDAGNFSGWCQRYLRYGRPGRLLAPISGAMGYAVPSAVAASIEHPNRLVLGVCGDGGFMMTGQEIATAIHHDAGPIIMVCNNNMYGTIRMHQERDFPGRHSATDLTNPDFVKLAESYGAFGVRIEKAADFELVWKEAVSAGKPALIEIKMDPQQISTTTKL